MIKIKIYTAKYEPIFLSIFGKSKYLMSLLLSSILKEKVDKYEYLNTKLIKDRIKLKSQNLDILIYVNNKIVNIELNTNFNEMVKRRNIYYFFKVALNNVKKGNKFRNNEVEKVIQVNLNFNSKSKYKTNNIVLYDKITNLDYNKNLYIVNYNVDFYKKMYYNCNRKLTKNELVVAILDLPLEELEILSRKENFVNIFKDELIDANNDDWNIELFSPEEERQFIENGLRKEGEQKGEKKGKRKKTLEIAKKLLDKNVDINLIMEVTNLSRKQIENI